MTEVATGTPAVRCIDFGIQFVGGSASRQILSHCDLEVPAGGFFLLRGPSGSGKSTLLKLLTGLWDSRERYPRFSGRCEVLGQRVDQGFPRGLRHRVAAVLQDEGLLDDLSPRENVELALTAARRSQKLALALLSQVGLPDPPDKVAMLSGGMRKRAGVARGLAAEPELFLFDEPTAGLDAASARNLAELLLEMHRGARAGRTTIVITHDFPAFEGIASGIIDIDAEHHTLRLCDPGDPPATVDTPPPPTLTPSTPAGSALEPVQQVLGQLGSFTRTLGQSLAHLPPLFFGLCARSVARCVLDSAFFVGLGSAMLGFLATFFALRNSPLEGAFQDQIIVGVGKVLVAVLAPMIVAFFFTARMAAGAAARLGTMRRTNQVSALILMGIRPADYLLTPLTLGFCLALPVVTLGGVVLTALASAAAASLFSDFSMVRWSAAFFEQVGARDARFLLLKTLLSGYFVSVWTYHLALGPKRSGQDVGNSVNLSIVTGMLTVLAIHGALTIVQFA